MLNSFHLFTSLPVELQAEIWSLAVRSTTPGVQVFSLSSDAMGQQQGDNTQSYPWAATYRLTAPKWSFGPISTTVNKSQATLASWTKGNPSTYLVDSGLWNACRHSHRVMRDLIEATGPMVVQTKVERCSREVNRGACANLPSQKRTIIVSPHNDLFILQLDNPEMFNWSLFEDVVPLDAAPGLVHIRHVGWQYHPIWASSLHDSAWLASLSSLCAYIVYGMRFGGLETLWLINYRIKRKHWVSSKNEVKGPEPKVFETDSFRLTEVVLHEDVLSPEQLPWDEGVTDDNFHTISGFLAFVTRLRLLVSHFLEHTSTREAPSQTMSIKILAFENFQKPNVGG
ncbi:unnamed protein product [Fusarium graminearum]|uniref:2EXR domain-containing protein n=1 Tax=Gibberella zeae TaxID=5518 RepID=A0A9N8RN02_GIBZA|nr:unnamed protein product [Fusarium graminearum]